MNTTNTSIKKIERKPITIGKMLETLLKFDNNTLFQNLDEKE